MRYHIRHALVQFAADTILEDVNFEVHDKGKIAVVGRNGCGKTTLLKLIAGDITMSNLDSDEECGITMAGKQEIGFLRQISFEDGTDTVEDEIKKAFSRVFACEARMEEITGQMNESSDPKLMYEYDALQRQMEALHGYTWKTDMEIMFQQFGFALTDLKRPIGSFSGGQQTKVAFIKLLLSRPDIMLLDEPTNHLDLPTIEWLEDYIKSYDKAVVIVSHDRMFLDRIIDVTYEIEYHRIKRYPGNYSAFMRLKEENLAKQQKDYELQQKEIQRLTEWIEKWKNTPTKVAATRSKRMAIEHMVKVEKPRRFDVKSFHAMFEPRIESYTEVLTARKLKIGYDEVLGEVSFRLEKGQRLAILGENGKGKSTLLKTLVERIKPLGGSFTIGTNVEIGYFDQQEAVVNNADPEQTVLMNFWDTYPDLLREDVRSALGAFLFSGEDVEKKMGQLSGGEKVRLALCKMFYTRPNLLILDEPTNHMDMVGKEALEQMLKEYSGTVLFVSHDRYFIKQIATGVLEFDKEEVRQYEGGYEAYLEEKRKREAGIIRNDFSKKREETKAPTLEDVFDKKAYYNPGKIKSRLIKQLEKYERQLAESEEKAGELKLKLMDPSLGTDYEKLMELQRELEEQEHLQETLLERMVETEKELEECELL
ncbi:MAG: ATP-binding cassette domain-containing protein [Lachnospiraceae bacterium]|nr:ATP-binding cassette domain-containing protein [Lachnospiraceae bacterium]